MVNTSSTMENSMSLFSVSPSKLSKFTGDNFIQSVSTSLFNLSKPFNLSNTLKSNNSSMDRTQTNESSQYNTTMFTFPEPFGSHHMNSYNGGGKVLNKQNSKRCQPYSLSKPKVVVNPANSSEEHISSSNSSNASCSLSSSSSNTSSSSQNQQQHQQQQQPNAILARLSNISNSFKSIFVRPKNTKPVELGKQLLLMLF